MNTGAGENLVENLEGVTKLGENLLLMKTRGQTSRIQAEELLADEWSATLAAPEGPHELHRKHTCVKGEQAGKKDAMGSYQYKLTSYLYYSSWRMLHGSSFAYLHLSLSTEVREAWTPGHEALTNERDEDSRCHEEDTIGEGVLYWPVRTSTSKLHHAKATVHAANTLLKLFLHHRSLLKLSDHQASFSVTDRIYLSISSSSRSILPRPFFKLDYQVLFQHGRLCEGAEVSRCQKEGIAGVLCPAHALPVLWMSSLANTLPLL
ncbi:hypothetical protein E2C01_004607 [Portunus trituberculatus]|uniref:Uncharacterized protein n=1 Tax=Portunus trituberculatus TaxID=210409 RepID=A0A5B7CSS7_PORTR|nr:hypothetical protein [Portunus trituberculatus]